MLIPMRRSPDLAVQGIVPQIVIPRMPCDVREIRARGMPLGLMPAANYEEKEIIVESGDITLLTLRRSVSSS